jgi:hypothetical protein
MQVDALLQSPAPLLLFLERLERVVVEIREGGKSKRKTLARKSLEQIAAPEKSRNRYEVVSIEPAGGRYVIARSSVDREALREAVRKSIRQEPQLTRWLDWRGEPQVGVAIKLDTKEPRPGFILQFPAHEWRQSLSYPRSHRRAVLCHDRSAARRLRFTAERVS